MNTYAYNIAGEVRYVRAVDKGLAFLKVFHGELKRVGKCSIKLGDLKMVRNPHAGCHPEPFGSAQGRLGEGSEILRRKAPQNDGTSGNKVFNGLRHL